jgi:hypothetical protein
VGAVVGGVDGGAVVDVVVLVLVVDDESGGGVTWARAMGAPAASTATVNPNEAVARRSRIQGTDADCSGRWHRDCWRPGLLYVRRGHRIEEVFPSGSADVPHFAPANERLIFLTCHGAYGGGEA